ncbi:MAG TPA: ABC transporter permease subunit [Jiangellaceae bacterium]
MNRTVIRITAQGMLGGRRGILVVTLGTLVLVVAVLMRSLSTLSDRELAEFLGAVSLTMLMPLFGLIVGTGAIGPEIDDGSVIHLLSKPVSRATIVQSKLVVALGATIAFAVLPTVAAALIMGGSAGLALAIGVGAFAAGAVYCVLFMLLAILTRHAVIIGLAYALIWESLVSSLVPGAREISIRQWALSVTDAMAEPGVFTSHVGLVLAVTLIVGGFVLGTWYAGERLRVLTPVGEE